MSMGVAAPGYQSGAQKSKRIFWRTVAGRPHVLLTVLLLWPPHAHADQQDDVDRVLAHLGARGTLHLGPRLLEQGEELPLLLPPRLLDVSAPGCTHVIVVGAQSVHFSCGPAVAADDDSGEIVASRAGMLELVRCGQEKTALSGATVTMLSLRGLLDAIAVSTSSAVPISSAVLPNRAIGLETAERALSRASELPRLGAWLQQLETSAALHGATRTERRSVPAQDKTIGESLIGFDPGCHDVHLLADVDWESVDGAGAGVELTWADTGELAARDALNSRAPALGVCTSQPRIGQLRFPAVPPSVAVVLVRSHFEWPHGIPSHWTEIVRNRIARVLMQKHIKSLGSAPVKSWMGGATSVGLKLPLAGNSCYLAVVASTDASGDIGLEVLSGLRWSADSSLDDLSASVSFCQDRDAPATITIDARDSDATWIFGIWNVSPLPLQPDLQ